MAGNAAIVAGAFAVSRLLGLVREIVIAGQFGTGDTYDAYLAAFRIPDLIFVVVMSGAFGSAFIPVFGGFLARDDSARAWKLANTLLTYVVVLLVFVAQVILLFAGPLIDDVIAPELPPDAQRLAVNLTRLLLLSPLLLGLGAAAKGMLEAHDAFTLPAIAPILYNLGIILGALALTPFFGVYGLAAGVILGAASHVAVQFAALVRYGFRFRPSFSRDTEGLGEVARLMLPRIAGQVASQANLIVMTNFASRLGEGRISALSYAQHLVLLPHGVLAMSLSTVIFPRMARQFELGKLDELRQTLQHALGPLLFLTIPAAIGLFAFRVSIVQVVLQYGSFTAESTALVSEAVGYFAIGLLARALIEPITRAFYAMRDTRTPLIVAVLAIIVNIAMSSILAPLLGHGGLALSISITSTLRMLALSTILSRRTGGLGDAVVTSLVRMAPAVAIMAVVAIGMESVLRPVTDPANGRSIWSYSLFVLSLAGAGVVFLGAAHLFRVPELLRLTGTVRRRLGRFR
ncbi:MAG: murein biosynthesis integral membrane protein MurJ [Chloroflexota bacterium]|nr:murein biosynthesis integral membrane protein MurJ [Chloroflexota bacterium]